MRNSYEMPGVFELGRTTDVMLGTKPPAPEVESVFGLGYKLIPLPDDIDDSDE